MDSNQRPGVASDPRKAGRTTVRRERLLFGSPNTSPAWVGCRLRTTRTSWGALIRSTCKSLRIGARPSLCTPRGRPRFEPRDRVMLAALSRVAPLLERVRVRFTGKI
jgi:hypothetical protein